MYLIRYVVSKKNIIYEIEPSDGKIIRRFAQPKDWKWEHHQPTGHWERYRRKKNFVFEYDGTLIFQEGKRRFELDKSFSCTITPIRYLWQHFKLFRNGELV